MYKKEGKEDKERGRRRRMNEMRTIERNDINGEGEGDGEGEGE